MKTRATAWIIALLMLLASCSAPAGQSSGGQSSQPQQAQTQDELKAEIAERRAAGDYNGTYEAAMKLLAEDPASTEAYLAALDALSELAVQSYEELNRLLADGAESAEDPAALVRWARENQPDLKVSVPYVQDTLSPDEINTVGITTGNMTNCAKYSSYNGWWVGGLLTWQGEWVYLSRPDEDFAIYRMRYDGSECRRLEANGSSLNAVGEWLYFVDHHDSGRICRIRTDGEMKGGIGDDTDCAFLSVAGEWMYYHNGSDGGCLYRMKTDGSARQKLVDAMVMFACVAEDGYVYYAEKRENSGIYRIPAEGGAAQTVIASGYQQYSLRDDNGENEVLGRASSDAVRTYCVLDGWVYFCDGADRCSVRRVRTDGTGYENIWPFPTPLTTMNVADGVLSCSFGDGYEEDGFLTGTEIVTMDMSSVEKLHRVRDSDKLQHVSADTAPICTGPEGYIYYFKHSDGMAWYGLSPDGEEFRIG